jgi:hypothetical protein
VEIEVEQREMEQELLPRERHGLPADRQRDLAPLGAVDLGRVKPFT